MNLSAISLWTTREDHQFFLSRRSLLSFTPRGFGRCNAKSAPLEMRTKKKDDHSPRGVLLLLVRRLSTRSNGNTQFFLVRVGACEFKGKKEEFFWHYWGGSVLFTFCFPYFFLSFVSLTSLSLFQHKTNDFLSKLACVTFAVVEGVFRSIGAF